MSSLEAVPGKNPRNVDFLEIPNRNMSAIGSAAPRPNVTAIKRQGADPVKDPRLNHYPPKGTS